MVQAKAATEAGTLGLTAGKLHGPFYHGALESGFAGVCPVPGTEDGLRVVGYFHLYLQLATILQAEAGNGLCFPAIALTVDGIGCHGNGCPGRILPFLNGGLFGTTAGGEHEQKGKYTPGGHHSPNGSPVAYAMEPHSSFRVMIMWPEMAMVTNTTGSQT